MLGLATLCALECYFPRISLFGPCADIIIIIIFFLFYLFGGGEVVGVQEFWAMGLSFCDIGDWILPYLTLERVICIWTLDGAT